MRTELLALLPGILAWWTIAGRSLQAAFLGVYLPVLLLIPDFFRFPVEGLPDPTFSQAAILPIGVAVCWKALFERKWTLTSVDFFVFTFVVWQFASDFYNVGFTDAKNLAFDMVTLALFPYVCGKALIESTGMRGAFARRFVWLLFLVSLFSVYEFRMGDSLFRPIFDRFFPGQSSGFYTQIRWGFGRIAGPYGHAILMGCILSIALLLCLWLIRTKQWERHFKVLGEAYFTKSQLLMAGLLIALGMTLSRGPWLGAACGAILASVGFSANLRWALRRNLMLLAMVGVFVYAGGRAYLDGSTQQEEMLSKGLTPYETTEVEQSTAYRALLFDKYAEIVMKSPVWGWGRANWPHVQGMGSIDNNYLFVALNTGLVGVFLLLAMMAAASVRLLRSGLSAEHDDPAERSFHFTLLGVIASIGITTASVFMGSQLFPLMFLFLGWADACAIEQGERAAATQAEQADAAASYEFMGVVA